MAGPALPPDDPAAAVLALQDLDLSIDRARHHRDTLPERTEVRAIDTRAKQLLADLGVAKATRDEIVARQTATEADLEATEERAKLVSKRLYSGEVSASRELQAMAEDVEHLGARASALEDAVIQLLEEREPHDGRVAALEEELAELGQRRVALAKALEGAEAEIDGELAMLGSRREQVSGSVPPDILSTYERLRSRLDGVGAARLVGNHCDGCHLVLPATELDRIRHLPPGELVTCDQCGRILVLS